MLVTALLLLGYFPLYNSYKQHRVSYKLICAFPIVSSVVSAILSFNIMVNAVYGYKFSQLGHCQLLRMQAPVFNDSPRWLLSTAFVRALTIPVCIQLFWAFAIVDFGVGAARYTIPCMTGGQVAVLVLAQIWAWATSPKLPPE